MENHLPPHVLEAIQKSKYNDTVILSIGEEDNTNTTSDDNEGIILVPVLDSDNGGVMWNNLTTDSYPHLSQNTDVVNVGILRHLHTKKWVLPMLHDSLRNRLFQQAIDKAIHEIIAAGEEANHHIEILDIGTGTNLLALMAEKSIRSYYNQNPSKLLTAQITSLEMASAMAQLAKKVHLENHKRISHKQNDNVKVNVDILTQHSCDTSFATKKKANLCISELLESGFLGEGILPTIRDAWKRHLNLGEKGGRKANASSPATSTTALTIPQKARIYAQVLESENYVACYRGPLSKTYSYIRLVTSSSSEKEKEVLFHQDNNKGNNYNGIHVPIRAENMLLTTTDVKLLTEPVQVLDFDFTSPDKIPSSDNNDQDVVNERAKTITCIPTSSGLAHGILFWWELDLWEGITYSTKPSESSSNSKINNNNNNHWQDHWQQCLYVFNCPQQDCFRVEKEKPFDLIASHTDYKVLFSIKPHLHQESLNHHHQQLAISQSPVSPDRALQLMDKERMETIHTGIRKAIEFLLMSGNNEKDKVKSVANNQSSSPVISVLDLSDGSICGILTANIMKEEKAENQVSNEFTINSVESTNNAILAATMSQIGNSLSPSELQILNIFPEQLSYDLLYQESLTSMDVDVQEEESPKNKNKRAKKNNNLVSEQRKTINLIVAEPYYEMLEGWHLEEALNFHNILRGIYNRQPDLISWESCIVLPRIAKIMGGKNTEHILLTMRNSLLFIICTLIFAFFPVAVELDSNLVKSYKEDLEEKELGGFSHNIVNECGPRQTHHRNLVFPMWQYGAYKKLTSEFVLGTLHYEPQYHSSTISPSDEWIRIPFTSDGTCHGMLIWVDYNFDPHPNHDHDSNSSAIISTNNRFHKQALRFLKDFRKVQSSSSSKATAEDPRYHSDECHHFFRYRTKFIQDEKGKEREKELNYKLDNFAFDIQTE